MWLRIHLREWMVIALQPGPDAPLVALGYSSQFAGTPAAQALPDPATIRERLLLSGVTAAGRGGADRIWWAVNQDLRSRIGKTGPGRRIFVLDQATGAARWTEAGADGETAAAELEQQVRWRETQAVRERAEAENREIESQGFLLTDAGERWIYRDHSLVLTERPARLEPWDKAWLAVEIPKERTPSGWMLRPWRMWIGEETWWRPEYDAALTPGLRQTITDRLAAWLLSGGENPRVEPSLPTAGAPLVLPRVTLDAMRTLLEFLLASGCTLASPKPANPIYPGSSDPMEVFRGRGAPRKWYQTQGGEHNVHVAGPIPATRVQAAFVLPTGRSDEGRIAVAHERIEASGGDLWAAYIWGEQ